MTAGLSDQKVQIILQEHEAVDAALRQARPGDLVVITADHVDDVWRQVVDFNPGKAEPQQPPQPVNSMLETV